MFPNNLEMKFWHAVALVNVGQVQESLPIFKEIFAKDKNWIDLVPRLPQSGTLKDDEDIVRMILEFAPKK